MTRRKKKVSQPGPLEKSERGDSGFCHKPFSGLKPLAQQRKRERERALAAPTPPPPLEAMDPADGVQHEDLLFARAMAGVQPIADVPDLVDRPHEARPLLAEPNEEQLVLRKLDELVHGGVPFDFADTEEYIEAAVEGFDHNILRKLKRGELSFQAHLDLHGMNREQARAKVAEFVRASHLRGLRCVLIVHGRGLGSKDNIPVLKNKLSAWLTRGAIGRKVLAFTSAKPCDGGTGAVYVLLRG